MTLQYFLEPLQTNIFLMEVLNITPSPSLLPPDVYDSYNKHRKFTLTESKFPFRLKSMITRFRKALMIWKYVFFTLRGRIKVYENMFFFTLSVRIKVYENMFFFTFRGRVNVYRTYVFFTFRGRIKVYENMIFLTFRGRVKGYEKMFFFTLGVESKSMFCKLKKNSLLG